LSVEINNLELKNLGLQFYLPSDELKSFIQCYWSIHPTNTCVHKMISDGGMGIVFNFGSSFLNPIPTLSYNTDTKCILTGPKIESFNLQLNPNINALGVRFLPGGAYPFLKHTLNTNLDSIQALSNKHLPHIHNLYDLLKQSKHIKQSLPLLNNYFLEHLNNLDNKPTLWINAVIKTIQKNHGTLKAEELASLFSLSKRHFERRFKKEVGLSPKQFSRIVRVQKARTLMKTLQLDSLTQISYACDYFDQAHFIHDFKFFAKETPKEYINRKKMSLFYNS